MANPRRTSLQIQIAPPNPSTLLPSFAEAAATQQHRTFSSSSFSSFLKKPAAVPFLLSVFILLTWIFLRFSLPTSFISSRALAAGNLDADANLVRFTATEFPSLIAKDNRGWLLDPIAVAREAGLYGESMDCSLLHVGQIRPGSLRGNHRHHTCNETFLIWGAETKFRLENRNMKDKGYAEVIIGADEVAIVASPSGTAHALINIDRVRFTSFLGCQDTKISPNSSNTDFRVWKDL